MGDGTIALADVRPGDLIFVEPGKDDPLGRSVVELDGGRFSHVGVCVRPGWMRSARTHKPGDPHFELGGLNDNDLAALMVRRGLHAATPVDKDVADALARIEQERTGVPDTDFSVIKLLIVSAALEAFAGADDVLRAAAWRAGRAWDERQRVDVHDPSYFCAEWVAIVYGAEFTLAEFLPSPGSGSSPSFVDTVETDDFGLLGAEIDELLQWARSVPARVADAEERWVAVLALVAELHRRAPGFIRHRLGDLGEMAWEPLEPWWAKLKHLIGLEPVMGDVPVGDLELSSVVPASLVTPRMLERASWIDEVRRVV